MHKKIVFWFTAMTFFFSFSHVKANAQNVTDPLQEQNTMSVLWFQKAGEANALFYQGYNIGRMRLDDILSKRQWKKGLKPAVVLDLDETVIDNSRLFAAKILSQGNPNLNWRMWVEHAEATALPGAIEFLNYANSRGVDIYYVSNRGESQKAATIKNLQKVGAPQADIQHVFLKQKGERGKETRRQQVAKTHNIVLLFGDNLGDFSGFEGLSALDRTKMVEQKREEFGRKLIVFPNPMYGDWEDSIYHYKSSTSDLEKARLRKNKLAPFQP